MSAQSDATNRTYLRREAHKAWKLGDEYMTSAHHLHGDKPEAGSPFEITVRTRIPHPMRAVTVYAHDLPEALHKAAALPLSVWWDDDEEGES